MEAAATDGFWGNLGTGVWLAGFLLLLLHRAVGLWRLHCWCRRESSGEAAGAWRQSWAGLPAKARDKACPRVRFVEGLGTPSVWVGRHVWLLLPVAAADWGEAQRRRVWLHELGHVRGRDGWLYHVWLPLDLVQWWNPAWWWLRSRMSMTLEVAADRWVVGWLPGEKRAYARDLIGWAAGGPVADTGMPTLGGGGMEERVRRLLSDRPKAGLGMRGVRAIVMASGVVLLVWLFRGPGRTALPGTGADGEASLRLAANPFPGR